MIIQALYWHFPHELRQWVLVVHLYGKISPIIISSKFWSRDFSLEECSRLRRWFLKLLLFLESTGCATSVSLEFSMFSERSRETHFIDRLMSYIFHFFFRHVLSWEISKRTMWIFWSIIIFPGFIHLIALLTNHTFKLVLTSIDKRIHCIWEARLSRLREFAIELCCNFGSIFGKLYNSWFWYKL